jgi:hypothetical protein
MSFTDRRRTGEFVPLVSVADDVADTVDTADSLETSVPWSRPYPNSDRFRPRAPTASLPRSGRGRDEIFGAVAAASTGCTVTDGREGVKGLRGQGMGELRDLTLDSDGLSASKSAPIDRCPGSRLEGELKKDLTLSTIDLLLFGP